MARELRIERAVAQSLFDQIVHELEVSLAFLHVANLGWNLAWSGRYASPATSYLYMRDNSGVPANSFWGSSYGMNYYLFTGNRDTLYRIHGTNQTSFGNCDSSSFPSQKTS